MSSRDRSDATLWSRALDVARRDPSRVAISHGDRDTSFSELIDRARDYRAVLGKLNVVPGDRVLVSVEASAETASAILGVWAAGAVVVLVDGEERGPHLEHVLAVTQARVGVRASGRSLPRLSTPVEWIASSDVKSTGAGGSDPMHPGGDAPASILFTSGSTGRPKGVTQTHASLLRGCDTVAGVLSLTASDRLLCPIPWSFDYGYGQLLTTFLRGLTQILPLDSTSLAVWEAIGRCRPSVLPGVPSLFTWLLRGPARSDGIDLSCLRLITNTGGAIPDQVLEGMLDLFAPARILLNYGLTETYRTSCLDPALIRERWGSIGRPIPGVEVEIRREDGSLAGAGEIGEIVHRGGSLFRGYWADPEATDRALRSDPADSTAPRVLFTGDLGRRDEDGFLYFVGRRDHQLKSMGVRVNPSEVEAMLDASGLVQEVAVFGIPHDLMGHEIWAAVVLRQDEPDGERKLAAYAHRTMSRYMKPRRYLVKGALPRTHTGKVDKPALVAEAGRLPSHSLVK